MHLFSSSNSVIMKSKPGYFQYVSYIIAHENDGTEDGKHYIVLKPKTKNSYENVISLIPDKECFIY